MNEDLKKAADRSVELLETIQKIEKTRHTTGVSLFQVNDLASRGANLIHSIVGSKSIYSENLRNALKQKTAVAQYLAAAGVLQAFHIDLSNGHLVNIRHEIETEVISEILTQAKKLSRTKGVHSAAVILVACAGLEEFLRNWCEEKGFHVPEKQRSIGKFAMELRKQGQIELPIERRISSWADYRNDAAHGSKWEKITQEIANRVLREIEDFVIENRKILC